MDYIDFHELDHITRENAKEKELRKIIFLDVDGVLHDYKKEINDVQEDKIIRLKQIVDATGAEIVLSSSWRMGYPEFLVKNHLTEYLSDHESERLTLFHKYLNQYGLQIIDFTPYSLLNENGRPLEIKTWLLDKPNIKSFVILDDEDFNWQWLRAFLVKTKSLVGVDEKGKFVFQYGLEDSHVKRAIAILNHFE